MKLGELGLDAVRQQMRRQGISLDLGVASFNVKSPLPAVSKNLYSLYANHPVVAEEKGIDFYIEVRPVSNVRRWLVPQVEFICDQHSPFLPLPASQAYPLLEWGMNWCVATHFHNYLLLHAAVLAKGDQAILFPAPPGSGKSTLTSWLAHAGWRLLSDEMAIIDFETNRVLPFVRPICLKNNSIDLVREWFADCVLSATATDTKKGDVAHLQPPAKNLSAMLQPANIVGVVFPKYTGDTYLDIYQLNTCEGYLATAENAFNANIMGRQGFETLFEVLHRSKCYEIKYNDLNALEQFLSEELLASL